MTTFVHIGTAKTGTTTIQHFFAAHRAQLKAQGFLYPTTLGATNHELAAVYAADFHRGFTRAKSPKTETPEDLEQLRDKLVRDLAAEVAASACQHVVISNEHLFQKVREKTQAERMKALLGPLADDVKIIVYLRRQDEFVASEYSERIRMGYGGSFEDYLGQARTRELLDYEHNLAAWGDVFGDSRVTVRVFEPGRLERGDALYDLAKRIGLDIEAALKAAGETSVKRQREGLDAARTRFLRAFNNEVFGQLEGVAEGFADKDFKAVPTRSALVRVLQSGMPGAKFEAPKRLARRLIKEYRAANDRLFARFGAASFDYARAPSAEGPAAEGAADLDDFMRIFAQIWIDQQNEMLRLRARLKAPVGEKERA